MIDAFAAAIAGGCVVVGLAAGIVPRLFQARRARPIVRAYYERLGCEVVSMQHRFWRRGPFPRSGSPYTRVVFRLLVRDRNRQQREVWARWGGTAFRLDPEKVDPYSLGH